MAQDQLQFSKLKGTRVLVLGGTSGIGFSTARMVLEGGAAHIVLSSSKTANVDAAITRLKALYPSLSAQCSITGTACDIGDMGKLEGNLTALLEFATDGGSQKLDHVVHTAGSPGGWIKPLEETETNDIMSSGNRAASAGILTKVAVAKNADGGLKYLNTGPGSSLTFTSGSIDVYPQANWHTPSMSTAAMTGLIRGLAATVAPVRVNLVGPGLIDTELWGKFFSKSEMSDEKLEGMKAQIGQKLALGQLGKPEDIAEDYRMLMCDRFMTGAVVRSDGGQGLMGKIF